ncbi:branched-chain amino acid ABC transporter permease [Neobacillus sp. GCM10023253]|uniref:branched-chain amino acid ABC transporter permease n=1 Tax=Neobacillus sp. GCM10023253 TaxID=3252644 RepID=UPI003615071B
MKQLFTNRKPWLFLLVLLFLAYPFIVGQSVYLISIFVMVCVYAITAMALDLLIGFGGQVSIGHAGFLSVGGYTVAILTTKLGLPFLLVLPLSGVITGIIGLLIGLPAVRLSGNFLAVVSLGFGLSIPQIALNWDSLTGGYSGLPLARPEWLSSDSQFIYVIILMTVLITWILHNIVKSRLGRAFVAIRESEVAAQATGINVPLYKTLMFVISAFFTGIAGGLYGYWIGFVSPNDFSVFTSFLLLGMIVIGGLASIPGAIIGAIIFTVLPELTKSLIGLTNIIIGIAIVGIILFRPNGLISLLELFKIKKPSKKVLDEPEVYLSDLEQGGAARDANV